MPDSPRTLDKFSFWDPTGDVVVAAIGIRHRIHSNVLFAETSLSAADTFTAVNGSTYFSVILLDDDSKDVFYFLMALYKFGCVHTLSICETTSQRRFVQRTV